MKKLLFLLLLFALFFPLPMSADENLCPQFSQHSAGEGFVDYESHEYINGFLSIHFKLAPNSNHKLGTAYKLLRSSDCQEAAPGGWWSMGTFDIPEEVNNFSIRFYQRINFGEYKYRVYNDDTNQVIDCPSCDYGFFNIVYFGGEPPHKFWLTLYTPYDFGYIPNLSVLPPTRFIASAPDIEQPEYTGKTPVLIVPGIMGTELYLNNEKLWLNLNKMGGDVNDQFLTDALSQDSQGNSLKSIEEGNVIKKIFHDPLAVNIFESLESDLINANYASDKTLFYFPYDWRLDLNLTKDLLKQKIDSIKLQTGAPKVDIIAHSMGGLLVKNYLNSFGSESVGKLFFVGTPHLGAPKAGRVLLEGDRLSIPWLEEDRIKELAENSPSIHQLMPGPAYFSKYQGYIKPYKFFSSPDYYDFSETKNYYLQNKSKNPAMFSKAEDFYGKNLQDANFSGVDMYNIAGCKTSTETGYQLALGNNIIGRVGYSSGDETVPLVSADYINIPSIHKFYVKKVSHSELPSSNGVRQLISAILNSTPYSLPDNVSMSADFCRFKGKTLTWLSPVEPHIFDSEGRHTGPIANNGVEYGVPGVGYSTSGDHKFIFLPTDEGQQYHIDGFGIAKGTFDLKVSSVEDGITGNTHIFNDVPVSTITKVNFIIDDTSTDNLLDLTDGNIISHIAETAVLNPSQSQDLLPPVSTSTLVGTMGQAGFYRSNVQITLSAKDIVVPGHELETSGLLNLKFRLDNASSTPYSSYSSPILVEGEGKHTLEFFSTDKAGNNEEVQTVNFVIDKTPPELVMQFDQNLKDLSFTAKDNLSLAEKISLTDQDNTLTASDEAGNKIVLTLKDKNRKNLMKAEIKSLSYNGQSQDISRNKLNFAWAFDKKKNLNLLSQNVQSKKNFNILAIFDGKKTSLVGRDSSGIIFKTLNALALLKVSTNKGDLVWSY